MTSAIAGVDFIGGLPILWPLSARGGVLLGPTCEDNNSGSSISLSMVAGRKSRSPGDDSASYVVPYNVTANIFSVI